jgi:hypothetical protein
MEQRTLGSQGLRVSAVGLGCMPMSHGYGGRRAGVAGLGPSWSGPATPPHHPTSPDAAAGPGVCHPQPGSAAHPRGPKADQAARLRRDEEIQILGYRTMVALNGESRVAPMWRVAAVTRRAERAQALARQRDQRDQRRSADRTERGRCSHHSRARQEREVATDGR